MAAFFGATTGSDLYFIAWIVPLLLGGIIGGALYASILLSLAGVDNEAELRDLVRAGLWISALLSTATLAYVGWPLSSCLSRIRPAATVSPPGSRSRAIGGFGLGA